MNGGLPVAVVCQLNGLNYTLCFILKSYLSLSSTIITYMHDSILL